MEAQQDLQLEIAHVLFMDVVGYSKLLIDEQREVLHELNEIVRATPSFRAAEAAGQLTRIPTGDGMALVFSSTPEAPVRCAVEISEALKRRPEIAVRMGINSGPVNAITDVNGQTNVAGGGINMAQRVMDCGDARHILLSKRVADDLAQYRQWRPVLHELGECRVKHDVPVSVVNLYTEEIGNPSLPGAFKANEPARTTVPLPAPSPRTRLSLGFIVGLCALILLAIVALIFTPAVIKSIQKTAVTATATPRVATSSPAASAAAGDGCESRRARDSAGC